MPKKIAPVKKTKTKYEFTQREMSKLKDILSNSAWSTSGYPDGVFAEDTPTPKMSFSPSCAEKMKRIDELKNMQCDLELAIRQKAIKKILNNKNSLLLKQMNEIQNGMSGLQNERNRLQGECVMIRDEIASLSQTEIELGKEKEILIKKIETAKREVGALTVAVGNGTIKDLEV